MKFHEFIKWYVFRESISKTIHASEVCNVMVGSVRGEDFVVCSVTYYNSNLDLNDVLTNSAIGAMYFFKDGRLTPLNDIP